MPTTVVAPLSVTFSMPDPIPGPTGPAGPQGPGPINFWKRKIDSRGFSRVLPFAAEETGLLDAFGKRFDLATPIISGTGPMKVTTYFQAYLSAPSKTQLLIDIGVINTSEAGCPCFPYFGFQHGVFPLTTLYPGDELPIYLTRTDIVDATLMMAETGRIIPNWPNWTMNKGLVAANAGSNGLYPSLCVTYTYPGGPPITLRDAALWSVV